MPGPSQLELDHLQHGACTVDDAEVLARLMDELRRRLRAPDAKAFEYFESAVRALRGISSTANSAIRIQCLLEACQFYYLAGKVFNSIEPARDAVSLARASGDVPLLRRSLNTLGILFADTGNCSGAIECYAETLEHARALKDAEAECGCWINL